MVVGARRFGGRAAAPGVQPGSEEPGSSAPGLPAGLPATGPGLRVSGVGAGELQPGAGEPRPLVAAWQHPVAKRGSWGS